MLLDSLQTAAIQITPVIALIWAASRFLSPKVQVWLWRLVFLRLTVGLLLWPTFNVPVLPPVAMEYGVVDANYIPPPDPFPIWQVLWAAGVAILAIVALKETLQVRRLVVESQQEDTGSNHERHVGTYRISDRAKVPMVIGLLRPTILIPRKLAESATAEELRMIVAHEQGHIAHGDLFWAWLIWAGRAAFFFHPLVWVAARCERFAREAAADRFAIERSGADPHGYGQVLMRITLADPLTSSLSPAGLTMSDSYRFIYRRLETMKTFSKRPTLGRLISTGALCAITFGLLPAFNFVPAAAQAPLDSATEPLAYPVEDDNQAVSQSPAIVLVQDKPAKKSQDKKARVKQAKPAKTHSTINLLVVPTVVTPPEPAQTKTFRVVDVHHIPTDPAETKTFQVVNVHHIPTDAAPPAPAAPAAPSAAAQAITIVPARPAKLRIQNVRLAPPAPRPATPPRTAKVRYRVSLPARAASAPAAAPVRYRVALPAQAPAIVPAKAPAALPPVPSAPPQIAAPAQVARPRYKRTVSTYQEGGATKYKVTLSRPLVANPAGEISVSTATQVDPASVPATPQIAVVSTQAVNVNTQAAPAQISTGVRLSNVRISSLNTQAPRISVTTVPAKRLQINTQVRTTNRNLNITKPLVTSSLRLNPLSRINVSTKNRLTSTTGRLITLKPIKVNTKISTTNKKKN